MERLQTRGGISDRSYRWTYLINDQRTKRHSNKISQWLAVFVSTFELDNFSICQTLKMSQLRWEGTSICRGKHSQVCYIRCLQKNRLATDSKVTPSGMSRFAHPKASHATTLTPPGLVSSDNVVEKETWCAALQDTGTGTFRLPSIGKHEEINIFLCYSSEVGRSLALESEC